MSSTGTAPPTSEDVTDADVQRAEREAAEAVALVDALEAKVVDGDESITHDEIEQAKSLGKFAKLRAQATARKAEQTRTAARLTRLGDMAEQMRAHQSDAAGFADLIAQLETAAAGLIQACADRDTQMAAWRSTMHAERVPQAGTVPAAEHGRVGWRESGTVLVDGREMHRAQPGRFIAAALLRAMQATGNHELYTDGRDLAVGMPSVPPQLLADPAAWLERYL